MIRAGGPLILLAVLVGCADPDPKPGKPPTYKRPDTEALLAVAVTAEDHGVGRETVRRTLRRTRGFVASQALWAAIARAENVGVLELYGVECFSFDEDAYRALFFVRTGGDRVHCLYADEDVHDSRPDIGSVPALPVADKTMKRLRQRMGVEVPLADPVYLASSVQDGEIFLLHVYRHGESYAALWYAPTTELTFEKRSHVYYARVFPIVTLIRALWASAPPSLFPTEEESYVEKYAALPGFALAKGG